MQLSVAQIQDFIKARGGSVLEPETMVRGWSIDSRTAAAGDLFFALQGDTFDGHDFLSAAFERGAAAAVVSRILTAPGQLLQVPDTLQALQQLARRARQSWLKPLVAVTGSAGKTTTKDVIAALLAVKFNVGKTTGNLNNHIGLPLSILRLPERAEIAVVEMGMNHAGEIRDLCRIASPNVGVVTNVGYAHIENFDSVEGIAAAKRELIESLPPNGTAILNADDPWVSRFSFAGAIKTFSLKAKAHVKAENILLTSTGSEFDVAGVRFETQLSGRHGISNLLAGIAVAETFGIEPKQLVDAVAELRPGKMRGERHIWNGVTVLNDAYNANPEAMRNMLDVLRSEQGERRIAVLGEMRELGAMTEKLHREIGAYAAASGVDVLIGVHGAALSMVDEAAASGISQRRALFFETPEAAGEYLKGFVHSGDTILFKGSRGTRVEAAISAMETNS